MSMTRDYVIPSSRTGELMDKKVYMILDTQTGLFAKKGDSPSFTTMNSGKVWSSIGRLRAHFTHMFKKGNKYDDTCVVVKFGIENFEDIAAYLAKIDDLLYSDDEYLDDEDTDGQRPTTKVNQ